MKKNNLLNIALIICKFLQAVYILFFILLSFLFVHVQIDKTYYNDKVLTVEHSSISYSSSDNMNDELNRDMTFTQMTKISLYTTYFRFIVLLTLLYLATRSFIKIIKSVQNLKTFRNDNVRSFRRIGKYVFIYFLVSSFYYYGFNNISKSGFYISFTPLIICLMAFILAEIFKEGNLLLEDKELTI